MTYTSHRKEVQDERMSYAIDQLSQIEIDVHYQDETEIRFMWNGEEIRYWPYKQWFQGKGIHPGRGLERLLKQLKK